MSYTFSILVPVYNRADYIDKTVSSVLDQTYKNFEIICVNDGSTDNSLVLLEQYACKDPRIKVINHSKNLGLYLARKTGVVQASGDYILFLDCDDTLLPNALEILENTLSCDAVDVLGFAYRSGSKISQPPSIDNYRFEKMIYSPTLWNKVYRAEVLKVAFSSMTEFYAVMGEDCYQTLVIAYFAKTYNCMPNVLYLYNDQSGVSNQTKTIQALEKDLISIKNVVDNFDIFVHNKNLKKEYVQKLESHFCTYMYYSQVLPKVNRREWKQCFSLLPQYFSEEALAPYKKRIAAPLFFIVLDYRIRQSFVFIKSLFPRSFKDKIKKLLRKDYY